MDQGTKAGSLGIRAYLDKGCVPQRALYSQFEANRWLHLGNLTNSYFQIETGKEHLVSILDRGYFCKYFPDIVNYHSKDHQGYLNAWNKLEKMFEPKR